MNIEIFDRLFDSIIKLEKAVESAKKAAENDAPASAVLDRLGYYEEILIKQRSLSSALYRYFSSGNWQEVARHIKLINKLSEMIRDDAREVLANAQFKQPSRPDSRPAIGH